MSLSQEEAARPRVPGRVRALATRWPFLMGLSNTVPILLRREQLRWGSVVADVVAVVSAYMATVAVRAFATPTIGQPAVSWSPDWTIVVLVAAAVSVFYASGLYEREAYVSRPLHLWVLLKASLIAFVISAIPVLAIGSDAFHEPWFPLLPTFAIFVLTVCILRLWVLDRLYMASTRRRRSVSFVLGDSEVAQELADRLRGLRGFNQVERVVPVASRLNMTEALRAVLQGRSSMDESASSVFIDGSGRTPREIFEVVAAARELGAEVYVVSRLLNSLEGNRLLSKLFQAPVFRVRRSIHDAKPYPLKRAFDVVGSAVLLLVCSPVIATLGIIIRLTSPGPVFYRQTRVGRSGVPFGFMKLRSMVLNHDASIHSDYVRAFMNGTAEPVAKGTNGETVYKRIDDPRITPVGRFIRKYSFDEIPQFWNVFRGEMSLVGPRPPLPYEVSEYDDWGSLRLAVPPGITGLWQVEGRSRVSFDEMVLQDVMYAQNMRLLLDVRLCLATVPAALFGGGGG